MIPQERIEKIFVYRNDIIVQRFPPPMPPRYQKPKRGEITEFTFQSRRKLAFVAANTSVQFDTMITLTYPRDYPSDGASVKGHLRAFLQYLRRIDCEVEYLWFIEFQKRGAPHFHLLLDTPLAKLEKTAVSERWYLIVKSGDEKHLKAGTRTEKLRSKRGGARYAVKYAMKMYQKTVPDGYRNVGRFWGHSQGVKPDLKAIYRIGSEDDLRLYLKKWLEKHPRGMGYKHLYGAASYLRIAMGGVGEGGEG